MAIIILPDGSIKVESEADLKTALAYQRLKAASDVVPVENRQPQPRPVSAPPAQQPQLPLGQDPEQQNLGPRFRDADVFLRYVADGGQSGVQAETLQEALEVKGPRGMGAKVFAIKNVLTDIGITEPDSVFRRERTPLGAVWQPGPRIQEAIQLVNSIKSRSQK